MITQEEQDIVHHFILLTIARKAAEIDLRYIETSSLKMKEAYFQMLRYLIEDFSRELALIKRYMHQKQLTVTNITNDGMFTHYQFVCRGYQTTRYYLNANLKNLVHNYVQSHFQLSQKPITTPAESPITNSRMLPPIERRR